MRRLLCGAVSILFFALSISVGFAQSGIITTYVGPSLPAGGELAVNVAIDLPKFAVPDNAGGFYVVSQYHNRVYRVGVDGKISVAAGNGNMGYSGDGRAAASAELSIPWGAAVDKDGNLYIADQWNRRIRKVTPAGIISTVAGNGVKAYAGDGGPATAASLVNPVPLAVDSAGNHFACFINQLQQVAGGSFGLPYGFERNTQFGTLDIAGNQPLSVVALRMTKNQKGDVLYTTTPVADMTQALTGTPIYFPQFADGGGYTTSLVLMNTSSQIETGSLQILDGNGVPLLVNQVGGTPNSTFQYSIPAGGAYRFQSDGLPATAHVGWVQIAPDAASMTPVGSGVFSYNPSSILVSESGIPSSVSTTHARVYVDLSGGHNVGLAVANIGSTTAGIAVNSYQTDGVSGVGTSWGPLTLVPYGQTAVFADQLIERLPTGYRGVLDISSTTPFAALTMRSLTNERNDFLMTTFPIADANQTAPSPVVFPHLADGGGYVTEFILISGGAAAGTTPGFYDDSGAAADFSH